MKLLITFLQKFKYATLTMVIVAIIFSSTQISSIEVNTNFYQFLNKDNPSYNFYKRVNSKIKKDESLLVLGIQDEKGVLQKSFLQSVDSLSKKIKNVDFVDEVYAITNISYPIKSIFGLHQIPYLDLDENLSAEDYKRAIIRDHSITTNYINNDHTALLVWISLDPKAADVEGEKALKDIIKLKNSFGENRTFLWGKKYIKFSMDEISTRETSKNILWSFALLAVILLLMFKRVWASFFALVFVSSCILVFYGGMVLFNRPFGLMSNIYPTIIVIVGMSDFIHMTVKYNKEVQKGTHHSEIFQISMSEIARAIFITSITTAIGFFTLIFSPMEAMKSFGLEAGIAVILTYVLFLCLSPFMFQGNKKIQLFEYTPIFQKTVSSFMKALVKTQKLPKKIAFIVVLLLVLSIWGIKHINTNNSQYTIPEHTGFYNDYKFFNEVLGGSRNLELIFETKDGDVLNTANHLSSIHHSVKYLESLPDVHAVKSPTLYYQLIHRANNPTESWEHFDISDTQLEKYREDFAKIRGTDFMISKDKSLIKLSAHMKDLGRNQIALRNKEIIANISTLIDTSRVNVQISGLDHLFDQTHQERIYNMFFGLLLAIGIIAIVLGLVFRNFVIVVIALMLNIIPLILTAGIMGLTNLELRAGTSIIFTIAFVIVVDDTVHLLSKLNWERNNGKSIQNALVDTLEQCGTAIITSSLILIGSFGVLAFSDLMEIYTFGILIGIAVLLAFLTDIILAPILIQGWFKKYL